MKYNIIKVPIPLSRLKPLNIRVGLALGIGCGILVALAGCGKGGFSEKTVAGQENMLRYPLSSNPTSLDPAVVEDGDTIDVLQQIYEGLVRWGTDNSIQPNLASSWEIIHGGTTYIFHLRKDVKFSNGTPFTANAMKSSIERSCDPEVRSPTASEYLSNIVGVDDRLAGKADSVAGVKVIDDNTLEIDLVKVAPYFLGDLTYPNTFAVCPSSVPAHQQITSISQMVGTGPFDASKYVEDQVFQMNSNPNYWDGKPSIDGIIRPIVKDAQTRLNLFKANQIDILDLQRQDVKSLQADPVLSKDLKFQPRAATWYVAFNLKMYAPFGDRRVRRAFSMAIDTNSIVKNVLDGINTVATGILPPGVLGFRTHTAIITYDPAKAKELLAQAGFPDGSKMPPLKLYFRTDVEDIKLVAEAVQNYLKKNLDVNVTLTPMDWVTYLSQNDKSMLPFYHMRWGADYLDPQDFLSLLLTTNGADNKQYYSNPQVDQLCARADAMPQESPQRLALYARAEDLILQDAAWLPIFFQRDVQLVNPRVHGLREMILGMLPHSKVSITH